MGLDARRAERRDGAEPRARAVCPTNFPSLSSWLPLHGNFFSLKVSFPAFRFSFLLDGGVFPGVRCVRLADRCRRFILCLADRPRTSSYPDSPDSESGRPQCRLCVTAATGGSAPSNRRVNTRFTSCSYGQDPPDRKFSHARFPGSCSLQKLSLH